MVSGFSTKKIGQTISLCQRLKEAREIKGVSIEVAESATKVRAKYLVALEKGKWHLLPQEVYTRGFVLAYARYLDLDIEEISTLFKREFSFFCKNNSFNLTRNRSVSESKVLITPKLLAYTTLLLFVTGMLGYIVFQISGFAGAPNLKILTPENNSILEADTINVSGVSDIDTAVLVNEENVPITGEGRFNLDLKLHRGVNVINVKAINKARKETISIYMIEYRPKTASVGENIEDGRY